MARARLTAMQAHHCSSEGALSSLEEAIGDKEKQMAQLREQRDRAEQDKQEERELHERELAEYKMKIHALESEVRRAKKGFRLPFRAFYTIKIRPSILPSYAYRDYRASLSRRK